MASRRSSSAVKRRSVVTRQDTPKVRKLRLIADPNGITAPAKIVRVKKGRKKEKPHMFHTGEHSMELDEANIAHYVPMGAGSSVRDPERILELPKNVSLSTMSDAHHFGIHGAEIVSAGGDIHINKYSSPNAERSLNRGTTSSLSIGSEPEIWMSRNTAKGASGSVTDLQFPNVIQTLSSCLKGIRRHLIPSRTTVDDIMNSPVFLVDFPTAMIPEDTQTYSRYMLQFRQGYPLYRSTPIRGVSETHWKKGIRIGDVGRVRPDGSFEFLFNINPNETDTRLPDGFETLHHVDSFQEPDYYSRGEHLLKGSVDQTSNSPITYKFLASGAILQLPEGAIHFEAQNKNDFSTLASRYAQRWYEYMNVDRSMGAPNGSLYLITGCIKCTSCATAVFSEQRIGENWLEFHSEGLCGRPRYMWKRMGPMTARVNQNQEDLGIIDVEEPRHCVFIRGFKITLGDKQWNQLIKIAVTQHLSQDRFVEESSSSGASSVNPPAKDGNDTSRQYSSSDSASDNNEETESSAIIQQLSSSASPMHPSDFISTILLQRNPEAKAAIVHDDDWLSFFPEDHSVDPFSLPVETLLKSLDEAYLTVDEHDCVSLVETQKEPAQRSTHVKTAIIKSEGKGHEVLSEMDVEESDDGRDSTHKPTSYSSKETDDNDPEYNVMSDRHLTFPPSSSAATMEEDEDQYYLGDIVRELIKIEDEQEDVDEVSLQSKMSKEEVGRHSSHAIVQDLPLMIPSVLGSRSLLPITPQHVGQGQQEAEYVKHEMDMDQSLADFGPSPNYSFHQRQSSSSNNIEPLTVDFVTSHRPHDDWYDTDTLSRALFFANSDVDPFLKASTPPAPATKPNKSSRSLTIRTPPTRTRWECGPDNTTCHHCRRRTYRLKMTCKCGRSWCNGCILTKYDNQPFDVNMRDWVCPCCQNSCRCDVCTKKRGETYISKRNWGPLSRITTKDAKDVQTKTRSKRDKTKRNLFLSSEEEWDTDEEKESDVEPTASVPQTSRRQVTFQDENSLPLLPAAGMSRRKTRVFIGRIQPCWGRDMVHKSKVRWLQEESKDDTVKRLTRDDGEKKKNPHFKKRVYIGNPDVFLELDTMDKYSDSTTHDMIATAMDSVLNVVNTKLESGWSLTDIKQELIESKFFQNSILRTQQ